MQRERGGGGDGIKGGREEVQMRDVQARLKGERGSAREMR